MQSYPGSPPPIRPWDDEGPVAEVTIWIPKTQIAEGHWMTVPIWARVSKDVHPCAEVHYDNGVGVDGVIVRYKNSKSDKWQKIVAETARGVKGKARVRRVKLGGKGYRFHRLVANAFYDMPIRSPAKVCHIVDREKDKHPNDAAANIYVGTYATNAADRDSAGVPKPGNSIPFEGKRPSDELWKRFATLREAAGVAEVDQTTVHFALKFGRSNTGPDDWTFRWIPMTFESEDEVVSLPFDEARTRVLTSLGREGRIVRSGSRKILTEIGSRGTSDTGYKDTDYIDRQGVKRKNVPIHRLMVELLRPEWIAEAERRTRLPWPELEVDHIDHDESNNVIDNLRVLSPGEHAVAQKAYAVEEIDAVTREPFDPPRTYESISHAAGDLGLNKGNVWAVCEKKQKTMGGRAFRYVDEAAVLEHREARKRKRESNAVD